MTATSASQHHPAKWGIVCLLSLGMVIAYVDRTNLSSEDFSASIAALAWFACSISMIWL